MASCASARRGGGRLLAAAVLAVFAPLQAGCYVASVFGLTDTASNEFDEALLGRWRTVADPADEAGPDYTELIVERGAWRSYTVTWREFTGNKLSVEDRHTVRLAKVGTATFFDATEPVGEEVPPGQMPVHILGRVVHDERTLSLMILDHEWFRTRMKRGGLNPLTAVLGEFDMVLITSPRAALRSWLAARVNLPGVFEDPIAFERAPEESK